MTEKKSQVKESVIRPCDKIECELSELIGPEKCVGIVPCILWIKRDEQTEGFLTFSISGRCNSLNFCLWKQDGKKLRLIQRFNVHNINLAQVESSIKYVRDLSFVKIRELGGPEGIKRID